MINKKYELRYLPIFYEDLMEKVMYISENLNNKKAANDLLNDVEKVIKERLLVPEWFEVYQSKKERKYKYYRIYVKNFVIYYVIIDDVKNRKIMEIRRFLYSKQDYTKFI